MARQRGSIRKKSGGKWLVRVYAGKDADGKRRYVSETVEGSKKDADKVRIKLLRQVDTGSVIDPDKSTLKEYCESWLETKKADVESKTHADYERRLERDVYPILGGMKLQEVTAFHVEDMKTKLLDTDLSTRTIRYTMMILNQALAKAHAFGLIQRNPCEPVDRPKLKKTQKPDFLRKDEVAKLLAKLEEEYPNYYPFILFQLTMGTRPGEAQELRWKDVDLDEGWVMIRRVWARQRSGSYAVKEIPKNKNSYRRISLPQTTLEVLKEIRKTQMWEWKMHKTDLVFQNQTGEHLDISRIRKRFKKALKLAGVKEVRLYDCRHTHATQLLINKVNPKVVQERLGHASVAITLDMYSFATEELHAETAGVVEQALFG